MFNSITGFFSDAWDAFWAVFDFGFCMPIRLLTGMILGVCGLDTKTNRWVSNTIIGLTAILLAPPGYFAGLLLTAFVVAMYYGAIRNFGNTDLCAD